MEELKVIEMMHESIEISIKELLNLIKDDPESPVAIYNDERICMVNGGSTFLGYDSEEKMHTVFSSGQNWEDQQKSYHNEEEMIEIIKKVKNYSSEEPREKHLII